MRLIDANWVFRHLKPYELSDEEWSVSGGTALRLIHKAIDNVPTIDAEVVVHGRWIGAPLCGNDNYQCSECGSWHSIHVNLRGEIS